MAKKSDKTVRSFEQDMKRLEEIVGKLEEGVSVEEAMALYEEGVRLSAALEGRLSDMERKVFAVRNMDKLSSGEQKEMDLGLFQGK